MFPTLKKYFGYDTFRPLQEEIISHILDGNDALVIMPTGGGKSICFQLPALLSEGLTLVVSPLIALMKDQVDGLRANGIAAAYINSSLGAEEKKQIRHDIKSGKIKILYLAPESIRSLESLRAMCTISLIAVDEAHCISSRGHDFRPAYKKLSVLKETFPEAPLIALTATADKTTRGDILEQLNIRDAKVFLSSFDRSNISLEVRPAQKRIEQIMAYIAEKSDESGIVYCLGRKTTEKIAKKLAAAGISAEAYHAGLSHEQRIARQERFIMDETKIICATIAFGMGIDKSNIRRVIHYNLSKNIEGYYQEIGRAGRDGLPADAIMFYSYGDIVQLTRFANDSGNRAVQLSKLERIKQYAESLTCRRQILLHYFGESRAVGCGNCDVCEHPPVFIEGTVIAQKALSTIKRLRESEPMSVVIDVLRGSKNATILHRGYDKLSTHGIGNDIAQQERQWYLIQLLNLGLCSIAFDEHDALKLTDAAERILFQDEEVMLAKPHQEHISTSKKKILEKLKKSTTIDTLFERLKQWRYNLSKEQGIAAYLIFSDKTLREIETIQPKTLEEFGSISGVGKKKMEQYGEVCVQIVNTYIKNTKNVKSGKKPKIEKGTTYMVTYDFLKSGSTPAEIAEARDMKVGTIMMHILYLYEAGNDVDIYEYISKSFVERLRIAKKELKSPEKLKPYFEYFGGRVDYWKIKWSLEILEKDKI